MDARVPLAIVASLLTATGCFTEPGVGSGATSSNGSASSTGATSGAGATTTTATDGSTGAGSTSVSGTSSSGSSGSSESSPSTGPVDECGPMARCVPMDVPGWDGPFLVFTTNIDAPAECPMSEEPEWTAYAEVEPAECDCQCGEAEADCIVDFTVGLADTCSEEGFDDTIAGVCQTHGSTVNSELSLQASVVQAVNPTSANPEPPVPTFASMVTACGLPSGDSCTDGTCIELLPPNPQVCITRPSAAGEQCPAGFNMRRVVAAGVSSDGLDCEACGCSATDVTCSGVFRFFEDAGCLQQFGAPLALVDGSCDGAGEDLDDVAGIRLDADVTGTISATGAPKGIAPAGGTPALEDPRTLCCL